MKNWEREGKMDEIRLGEKEGDVRGVCLLQTLNVVVKRSVSRCSSACCFAVSSTVLGLDNL